MQRDDLERALGQFMDGPEGAGVVFAYLFGSRARQDDRPDSDVDVAVLFDGPRSLAFPTRALRLEDVLETRLGLPAQVVDLEEAPVDLIHRVMCDGRLVTDRDRARRIAFEVTSRNRYFDLMPVLQTYRRARSHAP